MTFNLFDSHGHLQSSAFNENRKAVLAEMADKKIGSIVVGANLSMSKKAIELAEKSDFLWAAAGLHPHYLTQKEDPDDPDFFGPEIFDEEKYANLLAHPKTVAVGECGLDWFNGVSLAEKEKQEEAFIRHIDLSKKFNKPLILHIRSAKGNLDAHKEALKILHEEFSGAASSASALSFGAARGICHFFSADWPVAKEFLGLGFYISFAGPITFADQYDETVLKTPLDRILVETDCPYAAPAPFRGKRNEPKFIEHVIQKIAAIKGISFEEVALATVENAKKLFGIK